MINSTQLLTDDINVDNFTEEFDPENPEATTTTTTNKETGRFLTGILIGATLGGIASILSSKNAIELINQNIKKVGNAVNKTATNINTTVKEVGEAVQNVAVVVNDTFQDVEATFKTTAEDVGVTVKTTASAVKNTTENVKGTVKTTADIINTVKQPMQNMGNQPTNNSNESENETLYKLVPIE
ncbi:MAG: hypothetical protein ACRC2R_04505 [Xenococcaceae cyanobacterium]